MTQAIKDALADAETLRGMRRHLGGSADLLAHSLRFVAEIDRPVDWLAFEAARVARAAFRAVPGLRGR